MTIKQWVIILTVAILGLLLEQCLKCFIPHAKEIDSSELDEFLAKKKVNEAEKLLISLYGYARDEVHHAKGNFAGITTGE